MHLYKNFSNQILFKLEPETAHDSFLLLAKIIDNLRLTPLIGKLISADVNNKPVEVAGIKFKNQIGLAAGFDKNCLAIPLLSAFGFGHIEIGSITHLPQSGNPKPRIFRLSADRALINRMGFPSDGASVVAERLKKLRNRNLNLPIIGVNLGKTKITPIDLALEDYQSSFNYFQELADYFVMNVSSPNTPELRKLQEKARLLELFTGINSINKFSKPVFVKVAPDLSWEELDQILEVCAQANISGIIATNTTLERNNLKTQINEVGGLSGAPLLSKSLSIVRYIAEKTNSRLPIIAVGGISEAQHVKAFLDIGASLVQVYTGFVYGGPLFVKNILRNLN
jgi:dihydroorotate dehydrogenase